MANAAQIKAKVQAALVKVGTRAIISRGSGDADDYDVATATVTDVELTQVGTVDCSPPVSYKQVYRSADATSKRETAIIYVMPDYEPKIADHVAVAGFTFRVVSVSPYIWQDELVAYELEVSRD